MESYFRGHLTVYAEPGTIVGPNFHGEYLVARECAHDTDKACFWSVTSEDLVAVYGRDPQSVTETKLQKVKLQ